MTQRPKRSYSRPWQPLRDKAGRSRQGVGTDSVAGPGALAFIEVRRWSALRFSGKGQINQFKPKGGVLL